MKIVASIRDMQREAMALKRGGRTLGFVPTMGFLHEGHCSLIRHAGRLADGVVVSIFLNPMQFGPGEDLDRYPRDLDGDLASCRSCGVDVVFVPGTGEMYAADHSTLVEESAVSAGLCGASRPGPALPR